MIIATTLLTSCIKLLLIPAYRSTDFDVHRNWLAITHSLPINKWYYEETSEWTLDYPPLFAWFQYLLSLFATYFDTNMLIVENLNYASDMTILFQRLSVIVTDFVYVYAVHKLCKALPKGWNKDVVLPILLLTNCGLIMIDHIHFQYNGIMYGILLLSITYMLQENYKLSAFWFAFLLNMKHIYLYLAPAYFVYLFKHYCIMKNTLVLRNFALLGAVVIGVFLMSFGPFLLHIPQVLSRLFPFKRGLSHAYWAPNIWAIYNTVDKIFTIIFSKLNILNNFNGNANNNAASMTGGLVQEFSHTILPNVTPIITVILTVVFSLPALIKLFSMNKNPHNFVRCLVISGLTTFLFGWHVHEKAILMVIIPLSILSILDSKDAKIFLIISTVGHYSLYPLLFPNSLIFIKVLLHILYTSYAFYILHKIHSINLCKYTLPLLNILETIYLFGLIVVFLYENIVHKIFGLDRKLPFLPLMLTSFYCSLGIFYCWIKYYLNFLRLS